MKKRPNGKPGTKGVSLLLTIVLTFCILGTVVFSVAQKTSREMSDSAIQNLSKSLDLIRNTIEAVLNNEAEFQAMLAQEIAQTDSPMEYIQSCDQNQTMVKLSLILEGETQGISNTGEPFSEADLDFSAGGMVNGFPVSQSYVNYMGTWAYTIKCPVVRNGREIASLYVEYIYDSLDRSLPAGLYDGKATLYVMDAESQRFVLKPEGIGMRDAGHINLSDFYRANSIEDPALREQVENYVGSGKNILFYHNIQDVNSLNYMWAVNDGTIYLTGYVPIRAIQQEARTVNQSIIIVVVVMLVAFLVCCLLYYISYLQQERSRKEQEAERRLHSQQLTEALKAAQIANQSKTMFLSNMSHDIRTPMNAVLGFTTLLAVDADNPAKVREYAKKIMSSGQHLLSLINDILDVSKIESGKVVLTYEKFSLNDVVSSVDAIIHPMAQEKRQSFQIEVSGIRHEYFMGDETRINQILINLLSNAVKYTQEGGKIWLRILGLKQRSGQYEHVRIEVEDNGYGMTPEYLEKIFDAFTRAENSTTNKVQGTGLGMAITKNVVELMGGTIEVSSKVGEGSLFRVELECRIPEGQADRAFWEKSGIVRLLLVSSGQETCENVRTLMGNLDITVDIVPDVGTALQMAGEGTLPVADWNTLGDDPSRAAHCLREGLPAAVPLLFLADYDMAGAVEDLRLENTGVLVKPFFVSACQQKLIEMHPERQEPACDESDEDSALKGLHFLAAEDNEINAEILSELLDIEGASCELVGNGRMAVERFAQSAPGEFDAILMDVQMPVMNGHDAAQAIRAMGRPDAAVIPIVAMTANAFAEDEKAALDAGMNAHIAKPLDIGMLKKVIRRQSRPNDDRKVSEQNESMQIERIETDEA